jgi:amidohydrolase
MADIREDTIAQATWASLVESAVILRHDLHRHPELAWQEQRTASVIRERLSAAGIQWRACANTGTVAVIAANAPGAPIALRADIDALPLNEATSLAHASIVSGCMHACGHDGHTATLFAALWWLKKNERQLPAPVTLLFQPAEEGGHGARKMIEDGALNGVSKIYGWHNWPAISFGKAVCPDGVVMAANGTFEIQLTGQGGHASQPELCRDPVLAASAVTLALQQIVSRHLRPQDAAVISVTSIDAKSADTIIPDSARLCGSIRLASDSIRARVEELITSISQDTANAYGVRAEVKLFPRYGATINHADAAADYRQVLAAEFGDSWHSGDTAMPIMASEDFSYYLNVIPGAFALIGAGDDGGYSAPCHSTRYDFNDRLIQCMGRVYARLAGAPIPE